MRRTMILFILPAILIFFASATLSAERPDYSRPFPLSLLEYPQEGGFYNPWPFDVVNIQINTDNTTQLQNEEMVAVNPQNPNNAVALWRDFRLGFRRIGVGYTFDGGQTWHDTLLFVPPYPWQSDPVLTVDSSGNYFACSLCLQSTSQGPTGIYVQKSTDGGISWSDPVIAVDSAVQYFEDKQMITLDRSLAPSYGNIYIAWTRFSADLSTSRIACVASTDGGASYNNPVFVSDQSGVQWPVPTTDTAGTLFIAWFRYFPSGIYLDYSTNQGQTFHTDRLVATVHTLSTEINGNILVFPFPALTSDVNPGSPYRGYLYIAFMDDAGTDMDILFTRSTNGGTTWSAPIRINDDDLGNGADQFHPWLSVDNTGRIHAIFYDRRLDVPGNFLFDLFYTRSDDGGLTWTPNERITSVSSDPSQAISAGLIGEYVGLSTWNDQVQMAWTDTRNGNQDVFSGRMQLTAIADSHPYLPDDVTLETPYPNPFNSSVSIRFFSNSAKNLTLDVVDLLGRRVTTLFDGTCRPGENRLIWNGTDVAGRSVSSGPYFLRLQGTGWNQVKRAVLLR